MDGFKQLDERRFGGFFAHLAFAITADDLAEQCDFFGPARDQFPNLNDNVVDRPASFRAARVGNNTKSAVLIALFVLFPTRAARNEAGLSTTLSLSVANW